MMKNILTATALSWMLAPGLALAGPVDDFEKTFRDMYGSYRVALFATNSGDSEKTRQAMADFEGKWSRIVAEFGVAAPPQYEDDPLWSETIASVKTDLEKAQGEADAGDLAQAHETLESIRDSIGDLHQRNGIETFSDRMNAYHAEMEHILDTDISDIDAVLARKLLEQAAVLDYLADDVLASPPPDAEGNGEYQELARALKGSVESFLGAARSADPNALKTSLRALKAPYSKFFLKFG